MFGFALPFFRRRKGRRKRPAARAAVPRFAAQPPVQPRPAFPPVPGLAGPGLHGEQIGHSSLREAFTPTRPQRSFRRVAGRKAELLRVLQAISQNRAHVIVYGDRGRGKTSLANLVATAARSSGFMVGRYSCSHDSDFEEIMRGLARDLPRSLLAVPVQHDPGLEGCEGALPGGTLHPRDLALFPGRLTGGHLLLIVDEFDRVTDGPTRIRFADTIKQISDRGAPLSFLIVGVSDSLDELLGRHPSIQRNIVGVPLPLLSDSEANDIIELGSREARLDYPPGIRAAIIGLARGVPYIVQLLGLHAGERAVRRGARVIAGADLQGAIEQAAAEMDPRIGVLFEELTLGGADAEMQHLLLTVALNRHDRFARFLVRQADGEVRIGGEPVSAAAWERLLGSGAVRSCQGAGFGLCTFTEAMLPHYILLRHAAEAGVEAAMPQAAEPPAPPGARNSFSGLRDDVLDPRDAQADFSRAAGDRPAPLELDEALVRRRSPVPGVRA